ncbi:MAG: LarC family nickel insertion protein [Oscillospiraceae bacterium]|nr:LarC family nickel insertion protein [Oscillospiraceae bacterium]
MKTLYIECNMGAAGDMLMSALSELLPNRDEFIERLNKLNIPTVRFEKKKVSKCGICRTHIDVLVDEEQEDEHMHKNHHHSGIADITEIISHLNVPEKVQADILSVYRLIAEAESYVHGCEVKNIHFHEVGTLDAVADITGVCMLINELVPDKIMASPVHVGSGTVKCAHGILPVPAPSTEYILRGVPVYGGEIKGELCTPTGAALLKHFVSNFGAMPVMKIEKTGYGMGTKDFGTADCVRVMYGETDDCRL